jgi:diguanylate cyclase (GGDEF)-like protein
MVDVDHFKKVNDTYGHLAGDHVLKEIGKTLRTELRQCDVIVRYGGEEFMVIMPETDQKQAIQPLERLRSKLSSMEISYGDLKIKVSISIGVASAPPVMKDPMGVIHRADEALYRAKRSGRNRVILNEQMPRLSFASVN